MVDVVCISHDARYQSTATPNEGTECHCASLGASIRSVGIESCVVSVARFFKQNRAMQCLQRRGIRNREVR